MIPGGFLVDLMAGLLPFCSNFGMNAQNVVVFLASKDLKHIMVSLNR